jgi:hypothetical protein
MRGLVFLLVVLLCVDVFLRIPGFITPHTSDGAVPDGQPDAAMVDEWRQRRWWQRQKQRRHGRQLGSLVRGLKQELPTAGADIIRQNFQLFAEGAVPSWGQQLSDGVPGCCSSPPLWNGVSSSHTDCAAKCESEQGCSHYSYGWAGSTWCSLYRSCPVPLSDGPTDCGSSGNTGVHTYARKPVLFPLSASSLMPFALCELLPIIPQLPTFPCHRARHGSGTKGRAAAHHS